jgi:rod shape determining protein RodA
MATRPSVLSTTSAEPRRHLGSEIGEYLRHLDYLLLAAVAGLVAYGLWIVQTVTRDDVAGDPGYYVARQAIYAVVGVVAFAATTAINPELYRRYRHVLYVAVLALMAVVFVVGPSVRGSRRWIDLGSFQFQPSELGKLVVIVFIAGFLANRANRLSSAGTVLGAVTLAALPTLLVFFEPDFGTALVYCVALAGCLYFSGVRWQWLAGLAALAAGISVAVLWALPAAGIQVLKPYQVDRLVGFVHPESDPSGTTYNINQAITAVGAGGLDGRGVAGATQTRLNYLPEHSTDFIFASLAEQRGFLGVSILLLLYAVIVWRGIKIIAVADSLFATTVAGAIVAAVLFQVFLNVGMNTGIAPITGIPLPFVSYGGSSLITSLAMIGVLQAIHARSRLAGRRY